MYAEGKGVPQNYTKAVELYQKAADQGNGRGQVALGDMYMLGRGVPQNKVRAMQWYRKSASQGNANALKKLKRLEH
ncbi:MAG: tetratricopeptide repeat protein [Candidatus Melainabacteria bacterium]|nr:tetratricopeptide repeat protein [Candidatus Melainabacteria bacterium]